MRLCEFNVAVIPDPVEEKTKGGLLLTADAQDREKHAAVRGTITHIAPRAFDEWPDGKPNVGEKVIFAKHSGMFLKVDGTEYRVLKDKDIVAVIE